MSAKRKKSKTLISNAAAVPDVTEQRSALVNETHDSTTNATPTTTAELPAVQSSSPAKSLSTPRKATWSWQPKAEAIAQIARESISVAQGATSESSASTRPPLSVSKSVRGSRKSIPLAAEPTKVHAMSDVSRQNVNAMNDTRPAEPIETGEAAVGNRVLPTEPTTDFKKTPEAQQSWLGGWWSRPDGYLYEADGERETKKQKLNETDEVARTTATSAAQASGESGLNNARQFEGIEGPGDAEHGNKPAITAAPAHQPTRSWFGIWSSAQNEQTSSQQASANTGPPTITVSSEPALVQQDIDQTGSGEAASAKIANDEAQKSSSWAFWSSAKSSDPAPTPGGTQKQVGELAVADTPSQSSPEAAQFNKQSRDAQGSLKMQSEQAASLFQDKRGRSKKAKGLSTEPSSATLSPADALSPAAQSPASSQVPSPSRTPPQEDPAPLKKSKVAQVRPNIVLPSFADTYPPAPNTGYVERLSQYLAQSLRLPGAQSESPARHLFICSSPPVIKKAVAIGVHGFTFGAVLQKVLGQPTGTSIRFANYAAEAIKAWCTEKQPNVKNLSVESIALEGQGYVAERIETLFKLLLNWLPQIRDADLVLIACHSQGVPVAVGVLAKLIKLGALSPNVRIGVCAMAGISLGPFLEYKSRFFSGTALELFDLCDRDSVVSRTYAEDLEVCLHQGARITFVASIDDQLVSLESALMMPLSHPYVSRAVFIDGRLHAQNFVTHLISIALKLVALGGSDHNLIREMSVALAGSFIGGEGHSRVYDDPAAYTRAVEFTIESTTVSSPDTVVLKAAGGKHASLIAPYDPPPNSLQNPFSLPWAARGMIAEAINRKELKDEVEILIKEFDDWKPNSKVLKDVRWRLEGIRSIR